MAITVHLTRNESGSFNRAEHEIAPIDFVVSRVPDGTPFKIYIDEIGDDTDVTEDFDALQEDATFYVVESPGGGIINKTWFKVFFDPLGATKQIMNLISPSQAQPGLGNQQGASPNNSLTNRTNKPRPYERTYDICGTVQSIPNDLMTVFQKYDSAGNIIEYGYYDVGRGFLDTPADQITDGDTRLSEITGSSAAVYGPYTSPNNGAPQTVIGSPITEGLYVTTSSNSVVGAVLSAPNDLAANIGDSGSVSRVGSTATILDPTGDSDFSAFMKIGDAIELKQIKVDVGGVKDLSGVYSITAISPVDVSFIVDGASQPWSLIGATGTPITPAAEATTSPYDTVKASYTDWITMDRIAADRVLANFSAPQGIYADDGNDRYRVSVGVSLEYQALDQNRQPYGPVYETSTFLAGKTSDQIGVSIEGPLPTPTIFRARARRVTDTNKDFPGAVIDDVAFDKLYAQARDVTPNYGNRTTIHTARRQTPRAAAVKSPKLALVVTERLYKYLGNGVFDAALSNNTQAVQSLIRLLRDPVCGGLTLTASNMDRLLSVQSEIEAYFGGAQAGQFCYTFDSFDVTMQDIINTVADAIFCRSYREGASILLDFDRPRIGPEMVFTHRSKAPGEKWTRNFNTRDRYDSLKFSYIDPATNTKETITIPADGGLKTETYDSKGIRNYKQAYWAAYRRYQRNLLNRVLVEFTAMEEGVFACPGRAISVVKGSRVSPFDGYVVAVDGLTVVLSQNVEFTHGQEHSLVLKRRDGSVQSVGVTQGANSRTVIMSSPPREAIYTGNEALKTEFSFGSDDRHNAQMMVVSTVEPGSDRTVRITGYNYTDDYYAYDGVAPFGRAFSSGFNNGFL